jgi:hypothetical protein
VYHR